MAAPGLADTIMAGGFAGFAGLVGLLTISVGVLFAFAPYTDGPGWLHVALVAGGAGTTALLGAMAWWFWQG